MAQRITGEQAAQQLENFVNNMCFDKDSFVKAVTTSHRTLQQSMFGLFMACIEEWSKMPEWACDARNEQTLKLSKEIMEKVGDHAYVPFI